MTVGIIQTTNINNAVQAAKTATVILAGLVSPDALGGSAIRRLFKMMVTDMIPGAAPIPMWTIRNNETGTAVRSKSVPVSGGLTREVITVNSATDANGTATIHATPCCQPIQPFQPPIT